MVSEVVAMEEAVMEMAAMVEECPGITIPSPRNSSPTERIILTARMISEQTEGVAIGLLVVMISEVPVVMISEVPVVMISEVPAVMISEHRVGQVLV